MRLTLLLTRLRAAAHATRPSPRCRRRSAPGATARLAAALLAAIVAGPPALASHTPAPTSVTVGGSLQTELGCPGDWQPDCAATHLTFDTDDGVWQGTFAVPAGSFEYKAALNDSWTENYGANATAGGTNIALNLGAAAAVKFYYDHETHWITDDVSSVIATAAGSFQSELGCPGDWQPDCLRSWLQDPDGDGTHGFSATLPAGTYEVKVAIDEGWTENYGAGGAPGGANIAFTVSAECPLMLFSYDPVSHVLSISADWQPTTTSLSVAPQVAAVGDPVTFTAAVGPGADGGVVAFFVAGSTIGTDTVAGGVAAITTTFSQPISGEAQAEFQGVGCSTPSASPPVLLQVGQPVPGPGLPALLLLLVAVALAGVASLRKA